MKIFETYIKTTVKDLVYLRPFFDLHIGSANCDIAQIKADIEEVKKTKNCYVMLGGDMIEAINITDKRFEWNGLEDNYKAKVFDLVREQCKTVVELFKPIKDRMLFALEGNHELKAKNNYFFDATSYICEELNIPNMGYSCFARLHFDRNFKKDKGKDTKIIDIYCHHGKGAGRTSGAKINSIKTFATGFEADIYLMGHNHGLMMDTEPRLSLSRRSTSSCTLLASNKLFVICGTYLKTYQIGSSNYGERAGYSPAHIGSPIIAMKPFVKFWNKETQSVKRDYPQYWVANLGAK